MDWRGLFSPSVARRRGAASAIAVVVVLAGVSVAVGHGASSHHARTSEQDWSRAQRETSLAPPLGWRPHRGPVPILMYHVIARPGALNPLLYVSGRTFAAQMRWLDRHGFEAVTLDQLEDGWRRQPLPRRPVVVSFDDGYRSHYTTAMPILARHRWPGVLSLATANMRNRGGELSPGQVQKLVDAGWELASHTISHVDLTQVGRRRLRREVRGSRRLLRYVFRVPVDNFTYPAGHYDATTVAAVRSAGYRGAMGVAPGLASSRQRYGLRRIRVTDDMGVRGLAAELKALHVR